MTFTKVKEVPKRNDKHDLRALLNQFVAEDIKVAKLNFNEHDYKRASYAATACAQSVKRGKLPIAVMRRGEEVYLVRTDM